MEDEINLKDYIRVIRRRWVVIVAIAIIVTGAAFINSLQQKPVYEATASLLVKQSDSGVANVTALAAAGLAKAGGIFNDLESALKSRNLAIKVAEKAGLRERIKGWNDINSVPDYKMALAVQAMLRQPKVDGNVMELKVVSSDPQMTADVVNAYAGSLSDYWNESHYTEARKQREYIESQLPRVQKDLEIAEEQIKAFSLLGVGQTSVEYQRLQRELDIKSAVYTDLRQQYEKVKLEESKEIPPFSVMNKALVPESPSNINTRTNTIIGLVFGLLAGTFVAFFQEYLSKLK